MKRLGKQKVLTMTESDETSV